MTEPLRALLDAQRAAFARGAPDYRRRMEALAALRDGLVAHQEAIVQAVSEDFGGRAREETLACELFPLLDQIRHARGHLRKWMRRRRVGTSWFLRPSRAFYQYQPLGVVGVLGAWNYQLLLTVGPMIDALAAGNHVILKPSEITPRSADVIARLVAERFAPDYVTCVTGGPEVAGAFTALPFDHLFFTGSTRVGHLVMKAASDNLVPVTLELGGKSPAIVHADYDLARAADRIVMGKLLNAGQTCVAPDYVLLPEGREGAFEAEVRRAAARHYPTFAGNPDYTHIVSARHFERLAGLVADAEAKGARVAWLGEAAPAARDRFFPPALVFSPTDDMQAMREEIFGPVLPVKPYDELDDAVEHVNAGERPLALYVFSKDEGVADDVLRRTTSGGACVNAAAVHGALPSLPFGGIGQSGSGRHHGIEGFREFSNPRAVFVRGEGDLIEAFAPPYGPTAEAVVGAAFGQPEG